MSELLLELFSEEIPAMMQKKASSGYKEIFSKYFAANEIAFDEIDVYAGPRRITIHIQGVADILPACEKELKGPKISAPQQAIEGFCRSNNITPDELSVQEIKGQQFYIYKEKTPERCSRDILLSTLSTPISEYVWPKSMYWGEYKIKWVRPLRNILCVFDGEVIPFEYGHLVANNKCYGHRFMSPKECVVTNFAEYKKALEENFVILSSDERREYISQGTKKIASKLGLVVKEDAALLEEVSGLVEHAEVMVGKIDEKFLSVPSEILVDSMKIHQKYFSLFDKDGKFAPYFLFVSNIRSEDPDIVVSGNEKVLSARLADALYFYNQDLKITLEERALRLEKVIFHAKLGSLKDKTLRLAEIVRFVSPKSKEAAAAALLCKSDIVSEVVDEFPSLQGIMGYYYAKAESKSEELALAIRDHYKPQGAADQCPSGEGAILALADKIDTLCGLMLAGEKPSGSKDPFALRRQAVGIVRIILENKLSVDLAELVDFVIAKYQDSLLDIKPDSALNAKKQVLLFLEERVRHFFKGEYNHELIASLLDFELEPDLLALQMKLSALKSFVTSGAGDDLLVAYKRANNIIGGAKLTGQVDASAFVLEDERALFACINDYSDKITLALGDSNYSESLKLLANLRKPIADFFDNVMVKDKDPLIANNRLLLLDQTKKIFNKLAKFEKF
ncbi:MAG: glycine--tRNA ligase subunit beta [Rickettsiales bacterium]|nr:MAG: glycine--tRNA ligase subunit beta [Rickettsiales bacterium]